MHTSNYLYTVVGGLNVLHPLVLVRWIDMSAETAWAVSAAAWSHQRATFSTLFVDNAASRCDSKDRHVLEVVLLLANSATLLHS
jgi:hypothetical protein